MLGLIIAGGGIFLADVLAMPWLDGAASVLIGVVLAGVATVLAIECRGLLIGEAAYPETRASIRALAAAPAEIDHVNEMRTLHFGPADVLVTLSLDFADHLTAEQVEDTVSAIEQAIKAAHPEVRRVYVEAQPGRSPPSTYGLSPRLVLEIAAGRPTSPGSMASRTRGKWRTAVYSPWCWSGF